MCNDASPARIRDTDQTRGGTHMYKHCSSTRLALALLAVATTLVATAAAADAPYGVYLGCFASNITSNKLKVSANLAGCAAACADSSSAILLITTSSECYCSNTVPDESLSLDYADCIAGARGVVAFYLFKAASTTQCRVSSPTMFQAFKVANGKAAIDFDQASNTVKLTLRDSSGARLESKDGKFLYGMFEIEANTPTEPGAVATFYTRSSDAYPNEAAGQYSEVDWEFCNAHPCQPAGLWLNSFTDGKSNGERLITVEEYQKQLGSSGRTDTGFTTYTLNWQPDSLSWAVNGTVFQHRVNGESVTWTDMGGGSNTVTFRSPNLPQMQVISMWTDTRAPPNNWGGILDLSKGPFYSYFRNLRRVVCDAPLPEADSTAMGPAWLYGKNETVIPPRKSSSASSIQITEENGIMPEQGSAFGDSNTSSPAPTTALSGSSLSFDTSGNVVLATTSNVTSSLKASSNGTAKAINGAVSAVNDGWMTALLVAVSAVAALLV